jgi:hypothetical protein
MVDCSVPRKLPGIFKKVVVLGNQLLSLSTILKTKSSLLRRLVDYEEEENEGNWNDIVAW